MKQKIDLEIIADQKSLTGIRLNFKDHQEEINFTEKRGAIRKPGAESNFSEPVTLVAALTMSWAVRYVLRKLLEPQNKITFVSSTEKGLKFESVDTSGPSKLVVMRPDGNIEVYPDEVDDKHLEQLLSLAFNERRM